jgi:hypothetical protein
MTITTIFLLLLLFQFKHFIADYPLQGEYMLGKFKDKGWILPLFAHVGVHGAFTFIISMFVAPWPIAIGLAYMDMFIHFFMDRLKASPYYLGKFKAMSANEFKDMGAKQQELDKAMFASMDDPAAVPGTILKAVHDRAEYLQDAKKQKLHNKLFWMALGFDQMVHHLTDLLVIYILATH